MIIKHESGFDLLKTKIVLHFTEQNHNPLLLLVANQKNLVPVFFVNVQKFVVEIHVIEG